MSLLNMLRDQHHETIDPGWLRHTRYNPHNLQVVAAVRVLLWRYAKSGRAWRFKKDKSTVQSAVEIIDANSNCVSRCRVRR
jgi:hypothetical protein